MLSTDFRGIFVHSVFGIMCRKFLSGLYNAINKPPVYQFKLLALPFHPRESNKSAKNMPICFFSLSIHPYVKSECIWHLLLCKALNLTIIDDICITKP